MVWLIRRGSAIFVLICAVSMLIWILPAQVPDGFDGYAQPGTLPRILAWMLVIGAVLALFEPTSRDAPDVALLRRSLVFLGIVALSFAGTVAIGFKWVAPILTLALMVAAHERRLGWLAVGAGLVPFLVWLLFDVILGRPLV
jgi:hypothetical protein